MTDWSRLNQVPMPRTPLTSFSSEASTSHLAAAVVHAPELEEDVIHSLFNFLTYKYRDIILGPGTLQLVLTSFFYSFTGRLLAGSSKSSLRDIIPIKVIIFSQLISLFA